MELNSLIGNFVCTQKYSEFGSVKSPVTYAIENGIILVLNNFQHILGELLVGMKNLAEEIKIFHNQKNIEARCGFKVVGICAPDKISGKMESLFEN